MSDGIYSITWFTLLGGGRVIWQAKFDTVLGLPKMWNKRQYIQKNCDVTVGDIWHQLNKSILGKNKG